MPRFAKLPLALLAVLAMLFLMPGLARAGDVPSADACAADPTTVGCPATTTGSAATPTGTSDTGPNQLNAVVPNAATDVLPICTDPSQLSDCLPPCTLDAFKDLPVCTTTPTPPPPCQTLNDLPDCTPDCAFLADLLGHDICTTLPQCLDPSTLPLDFPTIPGVPVCEPSTTTPAPSTSPTGVYYKDCSDARAHGASNIHRGQPGYRSALDSDNDGIACETSTSTGTSNTPAPTSTATQTPVTPVVDQLAYTGAVPAPMAAAGFGLLLTGAALLRLSRRPR